MSVSSSSIELLTGSNEAEARAALGAFENARRFFLAANPFPTALNQPVRIFAFQSKEEYAPYRLNDNAFGHYLHNGESDYIVLEDVKPEHYRAALHEYTHYAVKQAGFHLPTWLNEGIADLYSSLEPEESRIVIGCLLPERMSAWKNKPAISLKVLFTIKPDSPYYHESAKIAAFYAQSWALTHMLALDERYAARFPGFLKAVSAGMSSADAFEQVYGRSLEQLESDLKQYGSRMAENTASFNVQLNNSLPEPQVRVLSNEEKTLALADLLAAHPATAPMAWQTLSALAKGNPGNPSIDEKLGEAAWSMNRIDEARSSFGRAVEHGSRHAEMIYRYAIMQKQAGAPEGEIISLFERVLDLSPGFDDARFHLGILQFNEKRFNAAAQSLSKLKAVKEDWAYAYYSALAYCDMEFSNVQEARTFGEKARLSAKTANEQSQADRFLSYLQTRTAAPGHKVMLASTGQQEMNGGGAQGF